MILAYSILAMTGKTSLSLTIIMKLDNMELINLKGQMEIKEISLDKYWITWDNGTIFIEAEYNKIGCDDWELISYAMEIKDEDDNYSIIEDDAFIADILDQIEYQLNYY